MLVVEAFLVLRILLFCKFIYALTGLFADWRATEDMIGLMFPKATGFFAGLTVLVIIVSAFSVLFGFYGQIGGLMIFVFCLMGMRMHTILKNTALDIEFDGEATDEQKAKLRDAKALAVSGQSASAQKNLVIAAVGAFFFLAGTGPYSLTCNLF